MLWCLRRLCGRTQAHRPASPGSAAQITIAVSMYAKPIALITGASAGLGAAFARRLAGDGYDLVLVARRRQPMEALAATLSANCEIITADLTVDEELACVARRLASGDVDLLINNAGFGTRGRFWEASLESQEKMHRLHVLAAMRLTHAVLPSMVGRGHGAIINVSSVAAFGRTPGNTSYCATKAWMNAFTEGLYMELKSAGSPVRVQALCPGYTYTEFHDVMGADRSVVPKGWWMDADYVVNASIDALARDQLFVIPGARYRWLVRLIKIIPDSWRIWGSVRYGRKMKRT